VEQGDEKYSIIPQPLRQQPTTQFKANGEGVIDVARHPTLANSATEEQLEQLHNLLKTAIEKLNRSLQEPSVENTHPELFAIARAFMVSILKPLPDISIYEVWVQGIELDKYAVALHRKESILLRPALEAHQQAALDAVAECIGPFVLSTAEGKSLIELSKTFRITTNSQDQLKKSIGLISEAVRNTSGLATEDAKHLLELANINMSKAGSDPRLPPFAERTTANFLSVSIIFALTAAATGTIGAIATQSQIGKSLVSIGVQHIDDISTASRLALDFILNNHEFVRGFVAASVHDYSPIIKCIDWIQSKIYNKNKNGTEPPLEFNIFNTIESFIEDNYNLYIETSDNMKHYAEITHDLRDRKTSPIFDYNINQFGNDVFWQRLINSDGLTVGLQAFRHIDVQPNLAEWCPNWMSKIYAKGGVALTPSEQKQEQPTALRISGWTAFHGDFWIAREYRGAEGLAGAFGAFGLATVFLRRWEVNVCWALLYKRLVFSGAFTPMGYMEFEPNFLNWLLHPEDVSSSEYLVVAEREKFVARAKNFDPNDSFKIF
jgi:hypothetical protein